MEAIRIDDTDALDRLRNGERAALAQIHIEHVKPVYWAAYRVLRSYSDADEIAQDVFLTLWRKRRSVRVYGTSLLPWLLTTAKYLALNRARARNRVATKEVELFDLDLVVEEDPLTHVAEEKQTADLRRAIEGCGRPTERLWFCAYRRASHTRKLQSASASRTPASGVDSLELETSSDRISTRRM